MFKNQMSNKLEYPEAVKLKWGAILELPWYRLNYDFWSLRAELWGFNMGVVFMK